MQRLQLALLCVTLGGTLTVGGAVYTARREVAPAPRGDEGSAAGFELASTSTASICSTPIQLGPEVPQSIKETSQKGADCFAWQQFIALNWPASHERGQPDRKASAADFGEPGKAGAFPAVVWQTYMNTTEVFLPGATPPPAWNSAPPPPSCLPAEHAKHLRAGGRLHKQAFVRAVSNLAPLATFTPAAALQASASPQLKGFSWLADKNSQLVWYEVKLNETEYDFITTTGVYNAANQWALSQPGKSGVKSPDGAIHIKAAWRRITEPSQYSRYLMTDACISAPGGGMEWVQLGLVGLHIVRKVPTQPQWVWSTFEHVDNAPTQGQPQDAGQQYSFYDPRCTPSSIPASCLPPDAGPARRSCEGDMPQYTLAAYFEGSTSCAPYPTQLVRQTPIPDDMKRNPVQQLNAAVQQQIREANPDSVFQRYQLINVMWWPLPPPDNMKGGVAAPINPIGSEPLGVSVANTVLESYAQDTTCLDCHKFGAVATAGGKGGLCGGKPCAADFSFIFSRARLPADGGTQP